MIIQGTDLQFINDPLTYATGIEVLNGSTRQTYDENDGEYLTDRGEWALIIIPWVSCADFGGGDSSLGGRLPIASASYQIGTYVNGSWTYENVESTAADCHVVDSAGADSEYPSAPVWSLIFKRNVKPKTQCSIKVVASVTDPTDGGLRQFENEISLETNTTRGALFSLKATKGIPRSAELNPLRTSKASDGRRKEVLAVQLQKDNVDVDDANAVYFWSMRTTMGWERITADNQIFVLTSFDSDGNLPKRIEVDIDCFDQIGLKCEAAYYDSSTGDSKPSAADPMQVRESVYFSRLSRLDARTTGRVESTKGIRIDETTAVGRKVVLTDREGDIDDELASEFYSCSWIRRLPDNSTAVVGSGFEIEDIASALGMSTTQGSQLIPQIVERGSYGICQDSAGNTMVGSDGNTFMVRA